MSVLKRRAKTQSIKAKKRNRRWGPSILIRWLSIFAKMQIIQRADGSYFHIPRVDPPRIVECIP
jgi:hypothetical protein